ncbi:MAG TPA: thymidine phosphorylase [Fimbriimonadaceae bacterium]
MEFQRVIANRRDGKGNTQEELTFLAKGAAKGTIPDYQLAAWLMAAYLKPLNEDETAWLTKAMAESGETLDLTGLPKPWIDKHSTGGVGDKTSIVLLPLLASCGLTIIKMSGRGLGITGGTVDKLESVPGFRMDLSPEELKTQAAAIGLAITGQTPNLAPADKALYALRDVTATVDSMPLIVSSILSKKIAGGAERVMLDVKCGSGGFMTDLAKAETLAKSMIETGKRLNLPVNVAITDMSQPLGRAVGNLLEVKEAVWVLKGGKNRFADLCVELAAHTLVAADRAKDMPTAEMIVETALREGRALHKAKEWFAAQGATVDVFATLDHLKVAPVQESVKSNQGKGFIERVDARTVGEVVLALGGGREKKTDVIDPTVGVECLKQIGDSVEEGEEVFIVHAATKAAAEAAKEKLLTGIAVSTSKVEAPPLIIENY